MWFILAWSILLTLCTAQQCRMYYNCIDHLCANLSESSPTLFQPLVLNFPFEVVTSAAVALIRSTNPKDVISTDVGFKVHISLEYLCCYNDVQLQTISKILVGLKWDQVTGLRLGKVACAHGNQSRRSIVVYLDSNSQARAMKLVNQFEQALISGGIPIHTPRKDQQPFHSTLAVVNENYPIADIISRLNKEFDWKVNLTLDFLILTKPLTIFMSQ